MKLGDIIVYINKTNNYKAIGRYIKKDNNFYYNAAIYGGYNGIKKITIYTGDNYITINKADIEINKPTDEEITEFNDIITKFNYIWNNNQYIRENNLFIKAKFGDLYETINKNIATFLKFNDDNKTVNLYIEKYGEIQYYLNGKCTIETLQDFNIKGKKE